jgi:tetratricopeptide (TPR) repeat protein
MVFGLRQWRAWLLGAPLLLLGVATAITLARPAPASSVPYLPKSDAEVLETLPGPVGNAWLRTPAEAAPAAPLDAPSAVARARAELVHYQESADPRYLGRAEAALGNFWDEPSPPEPVLVLRARIRQSNHEFLPALADLNHALTLSPNDGQALLDRASIQTVLGHYDAARSDCVTLEPLTAALYDVVCRASVDGMTGSAATAYADLSRALAGPNVDVEDKCWAESLLGELSTRLGQSAQAEAHFRSVLAGCPSDTYARGALADLLLDLGRNAEVISLLTDQIKQDALLLRLAIAERAAHAPGFDEHLKDLTQRFEEAHLRGSSVHRREEARFELALRDAPDRALALAIANFQVQRETADVRIALESALAAGHPESVKEVVAFVAASKLEDPHIASLVARLAK